MNSIIDPGKIRGLQRVTSADGYFLICALDHLSDFAELLAPDPASVTFADVVAAKDAVVRAVAPSISAVLLDPLYALGHLVASGAVPGTVGLMSSIEDEDYRHADGPRRTRLRANWSATQIKMTGADMCKLLWFYRPDGGRVVAEQQRQLVAGLVAECAELSLPLVVEPIWYPLPGEDPTTAEWKAARVRGIIASAATADKLGVDTLKVEFPGYVDTEEGRAQAAAACAELDSMVSVPWVILSAGVEYADFKTQVEIACQAGAAGYLAGRSIWRDAVSTHDPAAREEATAAARARLEELNEVTRRYGRPFTPARPLDVVVKELPSEWYRSWNA
ncbi:tagatose 1,6-diphosphate aldolase [Nonomuraea sp. NPDC050022]|uniref:tagatose 1,6-diphosphate aldolase n=1 Tax=unclassified Nonomuraea TaxID=2593643 RepID=UPI003402F8E4